MWSRIYGLDIETDTTPAADGTARGLDPATTSVVNVAVATDDDEVVFRGEESDLLHALDSYLYSLPSGLIATWNGAVFDLPFLQDRAVRLGITLNLRIAADPAIEPKYEPLPGHLGGYVASWKNRTDVAHAHLDVAYAFKDKLAAEGVQWSLKPAARHYGLSPVEVDRTAVHLLSPTEQDRYVASDAKVTRTLAQMLLAARCG